MPAYLTGLVPQTHTLTQQPPPAPLVTCPQRARAGQPDEWVTRLGNKDHGFHRRVRGTDDAWRLHRLSRDVRKAQVTAHACWE